MRRFFILLLGGLFFLWPASDLLGRHIIGGVMTYECEGLGQYRFSLRLYRDCNCTNCADFDNPAYIAVYRCGGDGSDCNGQNQRTFFTRVNVPLNEVTSVDEPDYPCLIPPNVCVEEGIYEFSLNLPISDQSYHISYQRCCRNITINNIVQPENSGATYTIEITPEAQRLCNNSPTFNNFPPTVICADADLNFDHSATDVDGDQLVYEFCPPLLGGGPGLDPGLYETCNGAQPNPACPPPYNNVSFIVPTYTARAPMGGDPVVDIDPNTGFITGTPNVLGQFVVGVCVKEYRDGVLLSTVFRDFQFNVASCDPTVVADVKEDQVIGDQEFLINSCGNNTITFLNESFQERFIDVFEWRFNINNQPQVFNEWNATVTFPGVGQYEGQLILNPDTDCGDTANIFVNVYPDIDADFEFDYDTCVAGPVQFNDLSQTGAERLESWAWTFGDGQSSVQQDPVHTYGAPADFPVTLQVTDINQCTDEVTKRVTYFPVPALIVVEPNSFDGCAPAEIFFNNLSSPINESYDISWSFGDGGTSSDISPWYVYQDPGSYDVTLRIVSPIGCETSRDFNALISVQESPAAGFSYSPEQPSNLFPDVDFTDESELANRWFWDFGTGATSLQRSPSYSFPDTGLYQVKQIVTHPNGCTDTLIRPVDVIPEIRYYLPNAFTPNMDSVNDEYRGTGFLIGADNFTMTIWNRWGEVVFQTSNPDEGWNGRKNNSGSEAPNGVYVVLVTFTGPRGERYEMKEFATLIR